MKKKVMALLLGLGLTLGMSMMVQGATVTSGGIMYDTMEDGTATVSKSLGTNRVITVKDTVLYGSDSFVVTEVSAEAFAKTDCTKVVLPETIEVIGAKAFYGCSYLKNVNVPSSLKEVGNMAFGGGCASQPSFEADTNVAPDVFETESGHGAAIGGTTDSDDSTGGTTGGSTAGDDSTGTTTGGSTAGDDSTGTTAGGSTAGDDSIIGGTTSGSTADDDSTTEPSIPSSSSNEENKSASSMPNTNKNTTAQKGASVLAATATVVADEQKTTAQVTENNSTVMIKIRGAEYALDKKTKEAELTSAKNVKKLVVPKTIKYNNVSYKITSIADNACCNNEKLKKLTIRSNVKSIGKNAFAGCKNLKTVKFQSGSKLSSIKDKAFYGCRKLSNITLPKKVNSIGSKAFYNCKTLKKVKIKGSFVKIGSKAFKKCAENIKIQAAFF